MWVPTHLTYNIYRVHGPFPVSMFTHFYSDILCNSLVNNSPLSQILQRLQDSSHFAKYDQFPPVLQIFEVAIVNGQISSYYIHKKTTVSRRVIILFIPIQISKKCIVSSRLQWRYISLAATKRAEGQLFAFVLCTVIIWLWAVPAVVSDQAKW